MNNDDAIPDLPAATEGGKKSYYIQPQDEIEDDLLNQLGETSVAIKHCFQLGMKEGMGFGGKVGYLGLAAKLGRSYAALVQALDHHRGNGVTKQEILVQYVNVNGQAVIGNVSPRQGGGRKKTENQPQQQINHAPQFTMPSPDTRRQSMPVGSNGEW